MAKYPDMKIIMSQSGDFTRAKGKEVMEAFLKAPNAKDINVLFAHNDDMALGAIQAMEEAKLLILDEPTSSLDKSELEELFKNFANSGKAVLESSLSHTFSSRFTKFPI